MGKTLKDSTYASFLSIVNLHLDVRNFAPAQNYELVTVQFWHEKYATNRAAYMHCVEEIINKRKGLRHGED